MDATQRLDWDDEEDTPANRDQPVGNLHMFAGGYGQAQDFPIYPGDNVIGRHSSCDITLPAQSVSKKHAVLEVNGTCHTICDNNSLNKTRRNKTALNPHVHYALTDGEFLMFADVTCRYSILKAQLDTTAAGDSEDDSVMIPGTQGALAIEKTPAVAIRRMGGGTVLARDSGDEEEDVVQKERKDGGAEGSGGAQKTSGSEAIVPSAADTIVPESDEELDTSSNQERSPPRHPRCNSEADDHENSRRSSFIPSSLDTFLSPAPKEPAKVVRESQPPVTKEEKPVSGQKEETDTSPTRKDSSDDRQEPEKKMAQTVANDSLPQGGGQVLDGLPEAIPDAGLKDGGNNIINLNINDENNLKNDTVKTEPLEGTSTSALCIKDSPAETSKPDAVPATSTEVNQENDIEAKQDDKNPIDKDLKVTAEPDFCIDSDTDVDDELSISILDAKKVEEPESKPDVEQEDNKAAEPGGTGFHLESDSHVDEDVVSKDEKINEINLNNDTDVEDDTEPSKTVNAELTAANNDGVIHDADTIPEAIVSAGLDIDSNPDADVTRSDVKEADLDSKQDTEEKEEFHLDSDTDVEDDASLSSKEVKKDDSDSKATDISLEETKESIHIDSDTDVEEDAEASISEVPKEKKDSGINVQEGKDDLHQDSDTDVDEDDQKLGPPSAAVDSGPMSGSPIDPQNIETSEIKKDEPVVPDERVAELQMDSDTDVDEDEGTCAGAEVKTTEGPEGPAKSDAEKNESKPRNEDAALHIDSGTDDDEGDWSPGLDEVQAAEVASHSEADGTSEKAPTAGASQEDSSSVSVDSSVEEKEKTDSEGADVDMMATQSYIDPPETDLPEEEEEATQAYILSSTLAEPDPFKRPLDPIGVLQISAVTLDRSDEDIDEIAIAETQLFCHDADPGIVQTPQLGEETPELEEETQAIDTEESSRKDQELPQGVLSQGDTEPVSQGLSAAAPKETGTSLHLKRDVPASVWVKNIQKEGETSHVNEIVNQDDDSTQVEEVVPVDQEETQCFIPETPAIQEHPSLDNVSPHEEDSTQVVEELPRLELEATQSFLAEDPAIQEHPAQGNVPTHEEDSTQVVEELPRLELEATQSFLLEDPAIQEHPAQGNVPTHEEDSTQAMELPRLELETTPSFLSEAAVVEQHTTQDNLSVEEDSTQVEDEVPRLELEATESLILEDPAVQEHLAQDKAPSVQEGDAKPSGFTGPEIESHSTEASKTDLKASEDDATQAYDQTFPLSDMKVPQHNLQEQSKNDVTQPTNLIVEHTENVKPQPDVVAEPTAEVKEETKLPSKEKPPTRRGLSRNRKKEEEPDKGAETAAKIVEFQDRAPPVPESGTKETIAGESEQSGPVPQVSETKEGDDSEKGGRRRGGRRKAAETLESNSTTKEDVPAPSRKRTNKMASEAESSTSVKVMVEVTAKEKEEESKEEPGSSLEQCKDSVAPATALQNIPQTISLKSEDEKNDIVPKSTSLDKSDKQTNSEYEMAKDFPSTSLVHSGSENQISSTSTNDTESEKSKVPNIQVESKSVSVLESKKTVRGNRRVAAKAKNDKTEEAEPKDVAEKTEAETRDPNLEKQVDIKKLRSDSQDVGEEGGLKRTSRRSNAQTTESVEQEKYDVEDITSQTDVDKTRPGDQSSGNARSRRGQRNVKEEAKEDSQTKEKVGRLPPKRGTSLRGNQKNEEKNDQEVVDKLPQKTQKNSKDATPKTALEMLEIMNPDEGDTVHQSKKTGRNSKAERKVDEENQASSSTTETQGTRRTKRGLGEVVADKEEAVKEASARRTRKNSKADEETLVNEQMKRLSRTNSSKEGVESQKDTIDQKASRKIGRNVKEHEKSGMEQVPETKPVQDNNSKSERSLRARRKTAADEKDNIVEETETKEECGKSSKDRDDKELSTQEDKPRRGRSTKASPKKEQPEVSTPVVSRKRGQASKAEVEMKRKKSEETEVAEEEKPTGRRGRVSETKPSEEDSKAERSTRAKRKTASEGNEELLEKTETKEELDKSTKDKEDEELSTQEEKPRRGRSAKASPKEELSQVSTPVTSRKRGQAIKADIEVKKKKSNDTEESEKEKPTGRRGRVSETKPAQENIKLERSSRTRRNTETEDSEKILEKTVAKEEFEGTKDREVELSNLEDKPRRGRSTKASPKEELPQVSTPVTSRKRGQASKADVEVKRENSDETEEAKEEKPISRRGRPRKLTTTDDSQTGSGDGKNTPEPSPSRGNRQRPSSALSSPAEVQTPRRTNRLSSAAVNTSPYVPPPGATPKVLFTGVVDETGEQIIRSLGGEIADSVFDCTHLVTDRVRRTVKFLCALARGIPIVTLDWIDKCKKSGCFLSPTGFLVSDKEQEKNFSFVLSKSLQKAKKRPLFEGYEIHVTPSVKPEPEHMKDIIRCSRATYLPKMPRTFKEKCVIVSCTEDAAHCKSVPSRVPITSAEFILSGILRQEADPAKYLLNSTGGNSVPTPAKRRR